MFLGCSASYEPALQSTARSVVNVLQSLGVDFGVMENEKCSADTAIRLGDEVLFDEMARQNTEALKATGAKTIVTVSPHDFSVFSRDYKTVKDEFEIKHYTVFLSELLAKNKPDFQKQMDLVVTYHDPCYLSKHHAIVEQPRKILEAIPALSWRR